MRFDLIKNPEMFSFRRERKKMKAKTQWMEKNVTNRQPQ
jgi:hypothetical protein